MSKYSINPLYYYKKSNIFLVFNILIFLCLSISDQSIAAGFKEPITVINLVVDDSGSMNHRDDKVCSRMDLAKYALEAVVGLMSNHHSINLYAMEKSLDVGKIAHIDGKTNNPLSLLQATEGQLTPWGGNPFAGIELAYKELLAEKDADSKWLVFIGDGDFGGPDPDTELHKIINSSDINIAMLAVGNEAATVREIPNRLFFKRATSEKEVPEKLVELITNIYGYVEVPVNKKGEFTLKHSVIALQAFGQGQSITIGNVSENGINLSPSNSYQISSPTCQNLKGLINTYGTGTTAIETGKYKIDIKDQKTFKLYYVPNVKPVLHLLEETSFTKEIPTGDHLEQNTHYKAHFNLVRIDNNLPITGKEPGLENPEFKANYEDHTGKTIEIKEGDILQPQHLAELTTSIIALFRNNKYIYYLLGNQSWPVDNGKTLTVKLKNPLPTFALTARGITIPDFSLGALVQFADGTPLTNEEWGALTIDFDTNIYNVTKTSTIGELSIDFKPLPDQGDGTILFFIPTFLKIAAMEHSLKMPVEFSVKYSLPGDNGHGRLSEEINLTEMRRWWEKVIYFFCNELVWLLMWCFGYFTKSWMPTIDKRPNIKITSHIIGVEDSEIHASYKRSNLNWLPYRNSTGTIYLPPSISGLNTKVRVKAFEGQLFTTSRLLLLNFKDYIKQKGQDISISFGGKHVEKKVQQFSFGGNAKINIKTEAADYCCTLSTKRRKTR